MSREDLLADLQGEVAARPVAAAPQESTLPRESTPAFDLSVTPLQWSLPRLRPAAHGVGVAVLVGPVQVSVGVR